MSDMEAETMRFAELAEDPEVGARQTALMLHAMAPADRDWLLERLPSTQQMQLQHLLSELEAIGVEVEPGRLQGLLGSGPAVEKMHYEIDGSRLPPVEKAGSRDHDSDRNDADYLMALSSAEVEGLANAMRHEPVALIVRCLQIRSWPWTSQFLQFFPLAKRNRIGDLLVIAPTSIDSAQALNMALVNGMRQRCTTVVGPVVSSAGTKKVLAPLHAHTSPWKRLWSSWWQR